MRLKTWYILERFTIFNLYQGFLNVFLILLSLEAATRGNLLKKRSQQNSQENNCVRISFLLMLQASGCFLKF